MTLPSLQRLRIGDYGPDVEYVQSILGITVSGDFNFITDTAVRAFQIRNGLIHRDGIVDDATWSALIREHDRIRSTSSNSNGDDPAPEKPVEPPAPAPEPAPVPTPEPVPVPVTEPDQKE